MASIDELNARLSRLEDTEAIRVLKARYFFSCDRKDPQAVRDCFAPGPVSIDYGRIGVFNDREQLVDVFTQLGCHDHIVEMHHGLNPQIVVADAAHAHGTWGVYYHMINTRDRTVTQLGAYYEDEYRKLDGQWKISATRCTVTSTLVMDLAEGMAKILFAGATPPADVVDPANQA